MVSEDENIRPLRFLPAARRLPKALATNPHLAGLHELVGTQAVQVREGNKTDQLIKNLSLVL